MGHRDRLMRSRLRDVLVVTMANGDAYKGLLYAVDDKTLVLRQAEPLGPGGPGAVVDGELLLPRDQVAYMQRP